MRAVNITAIPAGLARLASHRFFAAGLGACVGVTAVAILTQLVAILGVTFGLRLGAGCGTLLGLLWGRQLYRGNPAASVAGPLLSLAGLVVIWPIWASLLLDSVQLLPEASWNVFGVVEGCGLALGLLTWTIPVAVATQLLGLAATPSRSAGDSVQAGPDDSLSVGCGLFVGVAGATFLIAPQWGVLWPALVVIAVISAVRLFMRSPGITNPPPPLASPPLGSTGPLVLLITVLAGTQTHAAFGLLAEILPATLSLWQWIFALLVIGWCGGAGVRRWCDGTQRRASANSPAALALGLLGIGVVQLSLAALLIDIGLWLSSRIVFPLLLELSRVALAGLLLAPLGAWLGWVSGGTTSAAPLKERGAAAWLAGVLLGELALTQCPDPLVRLWIVVAMIGLYGCLTTIRRGLNWRSWSTRFALVLPPVCTLLLLAAPTVWPTDRAVKLLFSTPALIGARSAVPVELLTQLDDAHLTAAVAGTEGRWSAWKSRGAELLLRCQGIPRGAITIRPDWSPQFPADVASTVWPLVLVDQPARVLSLGAGSSASLQAALAFPLRELVCCEADDALMRLLNGVVIAQGGFNPFADDRCRHVRHPANWLALPSAEQFDVIVSAPPSALLPEAASTMTVEFYRRAAVRLTAQGVFCQRFSSVDFGPRPLLSAAVSLQQAFAATACLEVGPGEYLLLGAHDSAVFVRPDLARRLEMPHVAHVLSRCNWDWSLPLNLPAYDRNALAEAAAELGIRPQTASDAWVPHFTPRDLMRWAPKLQETAALLLKPRTTAAVFPLPSENEPPQLLTVQGSRKSRYLEWLGVRAEDPELLRRLAEATSQHQLVLRYPDTYWWEYRKELREQLQDHPRTTVRAVSHSSAGAPTSWHPEDRRRKDYFTALGAALKAERPSQRQLGAVEQLLDPFDPLLTLFAHQELAELHARAKLSSLQESTHRLHVIYYAPTGDASVRNVVAAIDLLALDADAAACDAERFEQLNGLLQTLRSRWEARNRRPAKSARVTLQEVERSLLSVERAIDVMQPLAVSAGWSDEQWSMRKTVLDRFLVRPFRSYRDELAIHARDSERKTRELLNRTTTLNTEAGNADAPAVLQ